MGASRGETRTELVLELALVAVSGAILLQLLGPLLANMLRQIGVAA